MSIGRTALVVGAGSIGAHLSRSLSKAGWLVTVTDSSSEALDRFGHTLYPERYGHLPRTVRVLDQNSASEAGPFKGLFIGTPPDTHIEVLRKWASMAIEFVSIEKPLTTYRKSEVAFLEAMTSSVTLTCGFNHRVALSTQSLVSLLPTLFHEAEVRIEVEWRESWDGILRAHPWLSGAQDSYLGYSSRGGGALFEHSHGLDLALYVSQVLGCGEISFLEVETASGNPKNPILSYDETTKVRGAFSNSSQLSVTQDVVTWPASKRLSVSSSEWEAKLTFGAVDVIEVFSSDGTTTMRSQVLKNREEDFDAEIRAIELALKSTIPVQSPLSIESAIKTAKILSYLASEALGVKDDVYTWEELSMEGLCE